MLSNGNTADTGRGTQAVKIDEAGGVRSNMDNHKDRKGTQLGNFNFSDDKEGMISTGNHKTAMRSTGRGIQAVMKEEVCRVEQKLRNLKVLLTR